MDTPKKKDGNNPFLISNAIEIIIPPIQIIRKIIATLIVFLVFSVIVLFYQKTGPLAIFYNLIFSPPINLISSSIIKIVCLSVKILTLYLVLDIAS